MSAIRPTFAKPISLALSLLVGSSMASIADARDPVSRNSLRWRAPLLTMPETDAKPAPQRKVTPKQAPAVAKPKTVRVLPRQLSVPSKINDSSQDREKLVSNFNDVAALSGEIAQEKNGEGFVVSEREVIRSAKGTYLNHGYYHYYSETRRITAVGRYVNGLREGTWKRIYDGTESELFTVAPYKRFEGPYYSIAEFENGKLNGTWEITDCYGQVISRIQFQEGLRHGHTVWNHPSGERMYSANYRQGLLEGLVEEFAVNGMQISGHEFFGGRRLETDVEYYDGGAVKAERDYLSKIQQLRYRDDWWSARLASYVASGERIPHGRILEFYMNGNRKTQGGYRYGKLTGDFQTWFENGTPATLGSYRDDQTEGHWTYWHANGQKKAEGDFSAGQRIGKWLQWNEDGTAENPVASQARPQQRSSGQQAQRRYRYRQARKPTFLERLLN